MSDEPDQATIERRSQNADATFGCLGEGLGCAWILSSLVIVVTGMGWALFHAHGA